MGSAELKQLAASGELRPDDLIWKEGLKEWVKASNVKGLCSQAIHPLSAPDSPKSVRLQESKAKDGPYVGSVTPHEVFTCQHGFHKQRLIMLIAAGTGILATFLPWIHAPFIGAISGARGDGWISLLLFVPALTLTLLGDHSTPLTAGRRLSAVIPAGLASLIGIWKVIDFNTKMSAIPKDNPFAEALSLSVQVGIGLYLLVASGAVLGVSAWALERHRSRYTTRQ